MVFIRSDRHCHCAIDQIVLCHQVGARAMGDQAQPYIASAGLGVFENARGTVSGIFMAMGGLTVVLVFS